jgi:hypothetical protein
VDVNDHRGLPSDKKRKQIRRSGERRRERRRQDDARQRVRRGWRIEDRGWMMDEGMKKGGWTMTRSEASVVVCVFRARLGQQTTTTNQHAHVRISKKGEPGSQAARQQGSKARARARAREEKRSG